MNRGDYKNLYEKWVVMREWEYGPRIHPASGADVDEFEYLTKMLVAHLPDGLEGAGSNPRVVNLQSPWEAAVFLFHIQNIVGEKYGGRMVYRGQKRASWPLVSTLDRLSGNQHAFNRALLECHFLVSMLRGIQTDLSLFCREEGASLHLSLPLRAYLPVAQHYGVPTPLLDFTADPAVAAYFASRDSEDVPDDEAVIYCYQISSLMKKGGIANLQFTPPFFPRPYTQKGLFVEALPDCEDFRNLLSPDLEIRFPILKGNDSFRVIREVEVDLEPILTNMQRLRHFAKMGVARLHVERSGGSLSLDEVVGFIRKFHLSVEPEIKDLFKDRFKDPVSYLLEFVAAIEDMLYWLCYHEFSGGLKIDLDVLDFVVKSNPEIFRMMVSVYRMLIGGELGLSISSHQIDGKRKLIEVFVGALGRAGEKHAISPEEIWGILDPAKNS